MSTTTANIVDRILDRIGNWLVPEVAMWFVELPDDPEIQGHLDALAARCARGEASAEERAEFEAAQAAMNALGQLRAKAVALLAPYQSTSTVKERVLTEDERNRFDDFDWAQEAPEVQQHQGKFVVVHNKRVVAVGTDRQALVKQAAAQENCPEIDLVVMVVPVLDLNEIPH